MSSRLAVPVTKFTRSLSTTASVARPTHLLNTGSASAAAVQGRKHNVVAKEPVSDAADAVRNHTTAATAATNTHRPTAVTARPRKMPLMQGFRTSAPKPMRMDASTIDFAVLPNLHFDQSAYDPYAHIRVPLLPDNNVAPPAGMRAPEEPDLPLAGAEISVVAANPDLVLPTALTEVESMGFDENVVNLQFVHDLHARDSQPSRELEGGMIRDLWKGLVDDIIGPAETSRKPAA